VTMDFRIGTGFDVHRLAEGRKLLLGGVEIPSQKGSLAHSDGDVLLHAVIDALLGAAALGDIGLHFPDTDNKFKDISSIVLLKEIWQLVKEKGFVLANLDATLILEKPKIAPYINNMKVNIAATLETGVEKISVKATTTEGLGFTGTGEGVAAQVVLLLAAT